MIVNAFVAAVLMTRTLIIDAPLGEVDLMDLVTADTKVIIIEHDEGGSFERYRHNVNLLRARQDIRIYIEGSCVSACTFYLGLGHRVCYMGGNANFQFHVPLEFDIDKPEDRAELAYILRQYPSHVKRLLNLYGGLTSYQGEGNLLVVPANRIVRSCSGLASETEH